MQSTRHVIPFSRQSFFRELEFMVLLVMLIMTMTVVVEINMSISFSFVKIRIFDFDFGLEIRILTPSRVELIGKRSIFGLDNTTNR